jgi:hypothetical protein
MIAYWAVPYLVVAAPPAIFLLTILVGGCTMTRTAVDPPENPRFYSDPESSAAKELSREVDRRAARAELRRIIDQAQR